MSTNYKSGFNAVLIVMLAGLLSVGCSWKDKTISVDDDDVEMNAAIATARATLPEFWATFERKSPTDSAFALKVKIQDERGTEHFWLTSIERRNGRIFGTIDNNPNIVRSVKLGDRIPIPEADISDWLYQRGDKMVGNFTLRALFKQMPAEEVKRFKAIMADP